MDIRNLSKNLELGKEKLKVIEWEATRVNDEWIRFSK